MLPSGLPADLFALPAFTPEGGLVPEADLLTVHAPGGRILYASASSHRLLGYPAAALLGREAGAMVHPADQPLVTGVLAAARRREPARRVTYRSLRADGLSQWVEAHAHADFDPTTGQPLRLYLVQRELPLLPEAQPSVLAPLAPGPAPETRDRQELRYWQRLIDSVPEILWVADDEGATLLLNPYWFAYTGQEPGPIQHDEWERAMHPADAAAAEDVWQLAVRSHHSLYEEVFRLRRHDGTYRWHLCRAAPLQNSPGWVGLCTDIHDRQEALAALRNVQQGGVAGA